jgi:hypothetical protein
MKGITECLRSALQHFASDFAPFMSFYELLASHENHCRKLLYKLPCPPAILHRRRNAPPPSRLPSDSIRSAAPHFPAKISHASPVDPNDVDAHLPQQASQAALLAEHFQTQGRDLQQTAATVNSISQVHTLTPNIITNAQYHYT